MIERGSIGGNGVVDLFEGEHGEGSDEHRVGFHPAAVVVDP